MPFTVAVKVAVLVPDKSNSTEAGLIETEVTNGAVLLTVTAHCAVTPLYVAVMVEVPAFLPVTVIDEPVLALTVATEVLLLVHETFPVPPLAVADKLTVPFTAIVADVLFKVMRGPEKTDLLVQSQVSVPQIQSAKSG